MVLMKNFGRLTFARSIIFFFNVFLALIIIFGSYFFIKNDAGRLSLIFGFSMLAFAVVMRVLKRW